MAKNRDPESISERNPVAPPLPPKGGSESSRSPEHRSPQSSSEETGSESEEASTQILSNPVVAVEKPKSKKKGAVAGSSATPTPASKAAGGSKRKSETKGLSDWDSKKAKKKADAPLKSDVGGEDSKKNLFQRIWSEEDELVVLRGMIDYVKHKNVDPALDLPSFHDFIKGKLQLKVTKDQLRSKLRRFKEKYANNKSKGEDHIFSSAHERLSYQLSKAVWGNENMEGPVAHSKSHVDATLTRENIKPEQDKVVDVAPANERVDAKDVDHAGNAGVVSHPLWNLSTASSGSVNMEEVFERVGAELFRGGKVVRGAKQWMDFNLQQMELHARILSIKAAKTNLVIDALKSRKV